jgi:hypothetical protein
LRQLALKLNKGRKRFVSVAKTAQQVGSKQFAVKTISFPFLISDILFHSG